MIARCTNPNLREWRWYGGRGITVCARWREPDGRGFANFIADMGERPDDRSIDRVDNDGNYEPDNCRWATRAEQRANQRTPWTVTAHSDAAGHPTELDYEVAD